jgi:hypothetical protein
MIFGNPDEVLESLIGAMKRVDQDGIDRSNIIMSTNHYLPNPSNIEAFSPKFRNLKDSTNPLTGRSV